MSAILYRHRDALGSLLYVGISLRPLSRLAQHKIISHWFNEVTSIDLEHFLDLKSARKAEKTAIKTESPRYNIQGIARSKGEQPLDRSALDAAINTMGSSGHLAKVLGITKQAVSAWNRVPAERAHEVEAITGVPRYVLRPDLWDSPTQT